MPDGRLWLCEFCLKYMKSEFGAGRHRVRSFSSVSSFFMCWRMRVWLVSIRADARASAGTVEVQGEASARG